RIVIWLSAHESFGPCRNLWKRFSHKAAAATRREICPCRSLALEWLSTHPRQAAETSQKSQLSQSRLRNRISACPHNIYRNRNLPENQFAKRRNPEFGPNSSLTSSPAQCANG